MDEEGGADYCINPSVPLRGTDAADLTQQQLLQQLLVVST